LEREAKLPRILIEKELSQFFDKLPLEQMGRSFFDGDNGEKYLDIYAHLEHDTPSRSVLEEIKRGLSYNLLENRQDKGALEKLIYFAKFHNRKVCIIGFTDLVINVTKLEQHFYTL
jgi:hypothetical protein